MWLFWKQWRFFSQGQIYKLICALFLLCKGFVINIWVISNQILALCLKSSCSYTVYSQNSKSSIGDVTAKRELSLQDSLSVTDYNNLIRCGKLCFL